MYTEDAIVYMKMIYSVRRTRGWLQQEYERISTFVWTR